jgi:hypothetical protein
MHLYNLVFKKDQMEFITSEQTFPATNQKTENGQ